MQTLSISFLGRDRPGIVAIVSQALSDGNCNITQLTQTILGGEFAAIFLVQATDDTRIVDLRVRLEQALVANDVDMSVLVRKAAEGCWADGVPCQPYVVTMDGPDGPGLISTMARVFARHEINIEAIKAVLGHGGKDHALFVFEVMVPDDRDIGRVRREIQSAGRSKGLRASVQHRDIFEAMHRITEY